MMKQFGCDTKAGAAQAIWTVHTSARDGRANMKIIIRKKLGITSELSEDDVLAIMLICC